MIVETTEEKKWVLTVSVNDGSPAGGTGIYTKDERVKYRVREKNFRKFKIT